MTRPARRSRHNGMTFPRALLFFRRKAAMTNCSTSLVTPLRSPLASLCGHHGDLCRCVNMPHPHRCSEPVVDPLPAVGLTYAQGGVLRIEGLRLGTYQLVWHFSNDNERSHSIPVREPSKFRACSSLRCMRSRIAIVDAAVSNLRRSFRARARPTESC